MKAFIGYYKWHLIFLLLVIVCLVFMFTNMTSSTEADLLIGYAGINYVNVQTFNDNKGEIELLLRDANGDKNRQAEMAAYAVDLDSDLDELLSEMVDTEGYDIYITTRSALENFEDKSAFVTVTEYANTSIAEVETLKDKSGRIYAASLEDNDYVKKMGILNSEELFIAVAASDLKDGEELPENRKNARNIAGYILGEQ